MYHRLLSFWRSGERNSRGTLFFAVVAVTHWLALGCHRPACWDCNASLTFADAPAGVALIVSFSIREVLFHGSKLEGPCTVGEVLFHGPKLEGPCTGGDVGAVFRRSPLFAE